MTHDTIVALSILGVAGQIAVVLVLLAGVGALIGFAAPLTAIRRLLWGYELWSAFVIAAVATGGSLFFSEIAGFVPCELCWYQRICMYPLSIILLLAAARHEYRIALYLLPLPLVGACISIYHLLVENGAVAQSSACFVSSPGGCATKWINEFGYITIPTLALTAFLLIGSLLFFASVEETAGATLERDAER